MVSEVTLSAGMRTNLLSLQRTAKEIDHVQNIISTGLRVGSAIDNPQNFFTARSLSQSATSLLGLLDGIGQSVQTIQTASKAVDAISALVTQAGAVAASAREALADGDVQARITGNVDLSGISDLTSLTGVSNGDDVTFQYYNSSNVLTTESINIATSDSIEQFITSVKDIGGGGFFDAELTSDGYLRITEVQGNDFNINFDADGSVAVNATDSALASALGFGDLITATTRVGGASSDGNAEVTALSSTGLVSGSFYKGGSSGYADASDLLTSVVDSSGGTNYRFVANAGSALNLTFTINGTTTSSNINIDGLTVQGLVDAVNNDTNVGSLIQADYDSSTGKLTIQPLDSTVETINVTLTDPVAGGASTTEADFDFGTDTEFLPGAGAGDAEGETFYLARADAALASYEEDYNSILDQIDSLVGDASYKGVNLLDEDYLDTYFNESRTSKLRTEGQNLAYSRLGIAQADFSTLTTIAASETDIAAAQTAVDSFGSSLATALSIIQTRESFVSDYTTILQDGADKLTVADQNEEGAKLLALQTRYDLGVTALSLAADSQKATLKLF